MAQLSRNPAKESSQYKVITMSSAQAEEVDITSSKLQVTLQAIVDDVVNSLGYVAAMVAPLEMDNTLPVRAYLVNMSPLLLQQLEKKFGLSFISPESVAYLDDPKFKDNLSVKAIKAREILVSDSLYDLFRPVVNEHLSDVAQRVTRIKQVIAVPLHIDNEVVGNLFALSREVFSEQDMKFLSAFGNQAAAAIRTQRYLTEMQALERVILSLQTNITAETQVLKIIVDTVVEKLGYIGAMAATLEADNSLPVRTYAVGFDEAMLDSLEQKLGVSFKSSNAVAYLDDEQFKDNLSVRAVRGVNGYPQKYIVSNELYDLLRPVVDKPLADMVQHLTGIKQVMAIPFFIDDEVVGNLFIASQKDQFSVWEKEILSVFGQQAAVGLRNARLYHITQEQRLIAQLFGKMAFSAAANIHALRNHVGTTRTFLQLLDLGDQLSPEHWEKLRASGPDALNHLNEAVNILDNLHEPWRQSQDVPTDVNECLLAAVRKVFPQVILDLSGDKVTTEEGITLHKSLAEKLPLIKTSPDMLTEAFRVIFKNGVEAVKTKENKRTMWITSHLQANSIIEVSIRDSGVGIKPENLIKIFEMGWSTKAGEGMGFGLFWTKDYIEGLGGNIRAESKLNQGTTFIINLGSRIN